jgi:hypothetical protein
MPDWCHQRTQQKQGGAREALGKAGVNRDVLQKGQLKAWFDLALEKRIPC